MQSSSESYGGLTEDSLGEAYNSSKDGTLVMREVMNADTQPHTYCSFIFYYQTELILLLYWPLYLLLLPLSSLFCKLSTLYLPSCLFSQLFSLFTASQAEQRRRGGHTESNGFGNHSNIGNLPDLVQQSNSPSATPTTTLQELGDISEVRHTHTQEVLQL